MLELIFQGFAEWLYGLIVESWQYFASSLLDVMSLDYTYLKTHIPVINEISQVILAVGWALLIGNLVFQAVKSMAAGLGFEGEDPRLLFARTFVFAFLLLASPQICEIVLDMTSKVIVLLDAPKAINTALVDESIFGSLSVAWLLVIIFSVVIMFQILKLLLEIAERYVILAVLTITAPLAFAMGGSKNTAEIFTGWCRMYGSMCLLMATHIVFFKLLFSVLSAIPSGLDVFLWFILILAIVKTAKKADAIITRIGLNPALTGGAAGPKLPGMLAYTIIRTAAAQMVKAAGNSMGGRNTGASPNTSPGGGPRSGGPTGGMGSKSAWPADGGSRNSAAGTGTSYQQSSQQQNSSRQNNQQGGTYQAGAQNSSQQAGGQQTNTQNQSSASANTSSQHNSQAGAATGTRKTYVPPGARRSASYINNVGGSNTQTRQNTRQEQDVAGASSQQTGSSTSTTHNTVQSGKAAGAVQAKASAENPPRGKDHSQAAGSQSGTAGTGTRSTKAAVHSNVQGGAVSNKMRSTEQNNISVSQAGANSNSQPGKTVLSNASLGVPGGKGAPSNTKPARQGTRSTHRSKADQQGAASSGKQAAPTNVSSVQPGTAETRSTIRQTERVQTEQKASSTARQESGAVPSSVAPQVKAGTSVPNPGMAGTAASDRQARQTVRASEPQTKRANVPPATQSGAPKVKTASTSKGKGDRLTRSSGKGGA